VRVELRGVGCGTPGVRRRGAGAAVAHEPSASHWNPGTIQGFLLTRPPASVSGGTAPAVPPLGGCG
jgi:hypothetical protein